MKFGVIIFPGSNCDRDLIHVIEHVLQAEVVRLWHKDTSLEGFDTSDCILLPGGFSYGDYLRSGALAAKSPIMQSVKTFAAQGGYVWGICNGFQILCESGLLPGALLHNDTQQFSCKNVYLKTISTDSKISNLLDPNRSYQIPIAHAEGRYYADPATLTQLQQNDQILFQYCDADGNTHASANPNGSIENIAGICNSTRNVYGMMPHPERASESYLGNTDGLALFQSLLK